MKRDRIKTPEWFKDMAWTSFIQFALRHDPILASFRVATGLSFIAAPKSAIEKMIDDATGCNDKVMQKFIIWATEELYGTSEAPEKIRKMVREAKSKGTMP